MLSRCSRSVLLAFLAVTASVANAQGVKSDSANAAPAWIGVSVEPRTTDSEGVRIGSVEPDGPAHRAGVRSGDLVTQVNGRAVRDPDAFVRAVRARDAGERIRLTIVRDGRTRSLEVTAGSQPESIMMLDDPGSHRDVLRLLERRSRPRLGVEVMSLDEDLAAYFDTKAGAGLLVTRVLPGSGAADAGIKTGDVLLRVDGKETGEVDDLHSALENRETGDRVEVAWRRHGREERAAVEVGAGESARAADPMHRWTQRYTLPNAFSGDVEALRRELRTLKRDVEDLKRDLRDRR